MLQRIWEMVSGLWRSLSAKQRRRSCRSLVRGGQSLGKGDVVPVIGVNKLLVGITCTTKDPYPNVPSLRCVIADRKDNVQVIDCHVHQSIDGGVYYPEGGCVDDFSREVSLHLEQLTQPVMFTLNNSPYGPSSKVRSVTIHLTDYSKHELMRFTMPWSDDMAVRVIARIYKRYGKWHFHAIGGRGSVPGDPTPKNIVEAVASFIG